MNRRAVVLRHTIWCLLASWLCFSSLELLEQVNLLPETTAETQDDQDLDEAALMQLASGLKSDVPSLDIPYNTPLAGTVTEPPIWLPLHTVHQFGKVTVHSPPSLRLHQQLSVYRI